MGNTASNAAGVKVITLDGKSQRYTKPVKAAELMIKNPGKFLCDYGDLKVGLRIQGLSPDEILHRRRLYFLLPTGLLRSVLTFEDLNSLSYIASKALKRRNSILFGRIFTGDFCNFSSVCKRLELTDGDRENRSSRPVQRLMAKRRSWKPALETISET